MVHLDVGQLRGFLRSGLGLTGVGGGEGLHGPAADLLVELGRSGERTEVTQQELQEQGKRETKRKSQRNEQKLQV